MLLVPTEPRISDCLNYAVSVQPYQGVVKSYCHSLQEFIASGTTLSRKKFILDRTNDLKTHAQRLKARMEPKFGPKSHQNVSFSLIHLYKDGRRVLENLEHDHKGEIWTPRGTICRLLWDLFINIKHMGNIFLSIFIQERNRYSVR